MNGALRLRFAKTGKAVYFSHLDLMATLRRAILRTGVRMRYSEGFNPHPIISVALPLPVGCASIYELVDFEYEDGLPEGDLRALLNAALPEGLKALEVYAPQGKFRNIAWLDVEGELRFQGDLRPGLPDALTRYFRSESIVITKKTKSGNVEFDVAPYVIDATFSLGSGEGLTGEGLTGEGSPVEGEDGSAATPGGEPTIDEEKRGVLLVRARISAQNPTVSTGNIVTAIASAPGGAQPVAAMFTRLQARDGGMGVFR